jgi:hypothetical protein
MARMKPLSRLSFDQIRYAPGRPQPGAIPQHLGTFFQSAAQLLQLRGQQSRFATSPPGLKKRLGSLFPPRLVPPTDGLAVNSNSPRHFALSEAAVKKSGSLESPSFQVIKVALNASWITHAHNLTPKPWRVTILCESQ